MSCVVQLCHLLARAQKPEERRSHNEACEVSQSGNTAQDTADDQELIGWACHELPLAA